MKAGPPPNISSARVNQPLVTIILVTLNAGEVLRDCLKSILSQQEKNIEIIIIDGGSTDSTLGIINEFESSISYWLSEPDQGIYDAMNKAIPKATGKWIYFMGADDRLLAGFSEMALLLKNEDTLYYGNPAADGPMLKGKFSSYRMAKYAINHQSIFYPAGVFKKYRYSLRYKVFSDYALNLEVWGDRSFKKKYYNITVVWYNLTGYSATGNDDLFKREKPRLIKQNLGWLLYLRFLYKRRKELRDKDSNFY